MITKYNVNDEVYITVGFGKIIKMKIIEIKATENAIEYKLYNKNNDSIYTRNEDEIFINTEDAEKYIKRSNLIREIDEMKRKNITGLSKAEIAVIKEAFDLYDVDHTGFADISDIKESLVNLGYEQKNPVLFDIIAAMDTEENKRKGGISFFQFIEEINDKLDDKETPEGLRRIFDLFSEGTDIIKKENVVEICGQIAKEYDDPELHEALDRCAKNATNLTFDEFESIMTRKAYP